MTALAFDITIPHRLKALRTAAGLSASAVDKKAGFSAGTMGRMERGNQRIYATHLFKVSQVVGVGIGYFYEDAAGAHPGAHDPHSVHHATQTGPASLFEQEKQNLLKAYMGISDPVLKRNIYEMVEALANDQEKKRSPT